MYQLLTDLDLDRLGALYESLERPAQQILDGAIGKALNSRPQKVAKRPLEMRMKALRSWLLRTRDDELAGELLRAYLLGPRKELVTSFLDATGVPHEDGTVEEEDAKPDEAKVAEAVKGLLKDHHEGDVRLYLEIAVRQWPESEGLKTALDELRAAA